MDLTENDLTDLAAFFGRRLDVRLTPTPAPKTRAEERQRAMAWLLTLEEAQERGHLSALLLKISRKFPDDRNLQEACALLMDPGRSSDRAAGLVFLAAGAAGLFGMLTAGIGAAAIAATAWQGGAPLTVASVEPALEVVGDVASEAPVRNEAAPPAGKCTTPDGGRVGYWYAGARKPGHIGSVVTFEQAVNVRVDYPDQHNGFDKRSHIECVLHAGDRVELSAEPILVPGGRYWVPLVSGDLLPAERTARAGGSGSNAG